MQRIRRGFTLIEVSIFLAITGLLFAMVVIGVQNSISQQRFNDVVQNYVEFLRSIYAGVTNVQSSGTGNTERAIYGKMVTFGESGSQGKMMVYDVTGDANGDLSSGNLADSLAGLNAKIEPSGETYTLRWGAKLENVGSNDEYKGALMIIRHPRSGIVYTVSKNSVLNSKGPFNRDYWSKFDFGAVNYCIDPDNDISNRRRVDVKIANNARNSSGIEIVADNGNPDDPDGGNPCRGAN
ncbi:prepilin-type N-terminal cleavage/methylation domain-containing protein [Candidatus Saccharibacteria bacterium]|nr:prepilin-type N-terminal cleavage/methylation domain-containing protein [Candidatus Saccharibacteria bacterium]MBR3122282.1 prepilin-type N-terminal cleavage/methylation domain-containing protein [Candidatus Saccharibacteria bacterium]